MAELFKRPRFMATGDSTNESQSNADGRLKIEILSNYTDDMARKSKQKRLDEFAAAQAIQKQQLDERLAQHQRIRQELRSAWDAGMAGGITLHSFRLARAYLSPKTEAPTLRDADENEQIWTSGHDGERRVIECWQQMLDYRWTLLCGYQNRSGEIDHVLVGPAGVFTVEIKHLNGTVHCDGDRWSRDKYDNYGNRVDQGIAIADRRGRSPSVQLRESADRLRDALIDEKLAQCVFLIVMLSHPNSRIGDCRNPTVALRTLNNIERKDFTRNLDTQLAADQIPRVIEAIKRDHWRNNRPFATPSVRTKVATINT